MVTDIPPESDEDETPEVNKEQEKRNRGDYLTTSSNKKKSNKKNKGRQQTPDGASRRRESTSPPTPTTREEHEDLNEEESDDTRQQDEEEDPHDTDNTTDENETRIRHQQEEAGIKAFQHHQQKRASTVGENALKGMIRNVVRHQLFRAFKFIKEDDLAYDGTISKYILKRIGRQSSLSNPTFWSTHRGLVKKAIDSKRSTTSMAIKKEVISK